MPLQASGQISFGQIRTEFGVTGQVSMSSFYRKGVTPAGLVETGIVRPISQNLSHPSSGAIRFQDFYNRRASFDLIVSSSGGAVNYSVHAAAVAAGWVPTGNKPLYAVFTVQTNAILSASSGVTFGTNFFSTETFNTGSVITLVNNGYIVGRGGNGGVGGGNYSRCNDTNNGTSGIAGSPAVFARFPLTIINNGVVSGGGGGGGGGGSSQGKYTSPTVNNLLWQASGGGGGGGGGGGVGTRAGAIPGLTPGCSGSGWIGAGATGAQGGASSISPALISVSTFSNPGVGGGGGGRGVVGDLNGLFVAAGEGGAGGAFGSSGVAGKKPGPPNYPANTYLSNDTRYYSGGGAGSAGNYLGVYTGVTVTWGGSSDTLGRWGGLATNLT